MADDEVAILMVSALFSLVYWGGFFVRLTQLSTLAHPFSRRLPLYFALFFCLVLHLIVLTLFAAKEVRTSGSYILLFSAVWGLALGATSLLAGGIGISAIADGVERNNAAAVWAIVGAWLATTLCSCGVNIGEGPSIYTTLGPLLLAFGTWSALWVLFAALTRSTASIAVDRDLASGIRLAGLLVSWGIVLGRAVAGDWVSTGATLKDFATEGWPALVLLGISVVVEFGLRSKNQEPFAPWKMAGLVPGALYIFMALSWWAFLGPV
jgi:hypothetical protein